MQAKETKQTTGLTYAGRPRTWGLRFSMLDAVVLVVALAASVAAYEATAGFSLLILFVVLHFFLFCNVFRIRRTPELIWAAAFLLNCAGWILAGQVTLAGMMLCQLAVTAFVILRETRMPYYHGVFARRLNPQLDDYLAGRV